VLTDEEKALLLLLLRQKRTKRQQHAIMAVRDRKIAALVKSGRATFPQLINVVRWELESIASLAPMMEDIQAVRRLADNHARRIAYALLHETEDAIAAAKPQNLTWATEDAFQRASGNVVKLVAAETGSQVQWFTEKDERVCSVCLPRDGVIYQADAAPECPAHPRCRCALVAVAVKVAA
jgi:hypothetical protein